MDTIKVQPGDNLWKIARKQGVAGDTNIANYVNSVIAANPVLAKEKGEKLKIGQFINLPENSVFTNIQQSQEQAKTTDIKPVEVQTDGNINQKTQQSAEPTTPLNDWMHECADSMVGVDANGTPIYAKDINPFDMAGEEFRNDIKNNGGAKAAEIYKEKALSAAKADIALYDKDNDFKINLEEQAQRDIDEFEKKYGNVSPKFKNKMQEMSIQEHVFMDLDKDGLVDEKEYASFLYAMDANNDKKIADGKFTREEYVKTTSYFEDFTTSEAIKFRGTYKKCFNALFGSDSATKN